MCVGKGWHAINGPPPQLSRLGTWYRAFVWLCVCGGLAGKKRGGWFCVLFLFFLFIYRECVLIFSLEQHTPTNCTGKCVARQLAA